MHNRWPRSISHASNTHKENKAPLLCPTCVGNGSITEDVVSIRYFNLHSKEYNLLLSLVSGTLTMILSSCHYRLNCSHSVIPQTYMLFNSAWLFDMCDTNHHLPRSYKPGQPQKLCPRSSAQKQNTQVTAKETNQSKAYIRLGP